MNLPAHAVRALRGLSESTVRATLARGWASLGGVSNYFTSTSAAQEFRRQGRDYLEIVSRKGPLPKRQARRLPTGLPRALFVISTEVGGTPQTNQDLMSALSDRYEAYVLGSDARSLTLSRWLSGRSKILHRVRLPEAIQPFPHVDRNYDRVLAGWLAEYGFSIVHIRHVAWHSLSLPKLAKAFGIQVVFSFHDYYTICPTVRLVDGNGVFCGGTCTASPGQCRQQMWPAKTVQPLKHHNVFRWREAMSGMLADCDAFVTTSADTRERILRFFPQTASKPFPVIEHGRDFPFFGQIGHFPAPGERVRVLVPGNISGSKGAGIIAAMQGLDRSGRFDFHVLGTPARQLRSLPNVVCHGPYARGRFGEIVAGINPHFGVVLSIWAETFCHTLTEMWACGVPVAAFDLGAVGDRIRRHGGGWLISEVAPEAALAAFQAIASDAPGFSRRLQELADWQEWPGSHDTCAWMADCYDALYRTLLEGGDAVEPSAFGAQLLG